MNVCEEVQSKIAEDKTGDGSIYEMFRDELKRQRFASTGNLGETLDALGITYGEVRKYRALQHGLAKALREYRDVQSGDEIHK